MNKLLIISVGSTRGAVTGTASRRFYSEEMRVIKNIDTAFLKRGTGGRSSFNGNVVTVFGASGFIGKYICNQLGKRGCQLIIPHRCDADDPGLKSLKLAGDLGQVLFQPFDLRDPDSIRKAVRYSNIVINLIGRDFETKNFNFHKVHVKGATEIAKACAEYNVERLIHFSSLNLTEKPQRYYIKNYQFLPSKLKGEEAVRNEFPNATIFRPSAVYGFLDHFLWPLCANERTVFYSIPLYAKGEKTIRQPVFVSDVAKGVVNAINDYDTRGKVYQIVGPERFYLKDIAIFCSQTLQRHLVVKTLVHNIKFDMIFPLKILMYRKIFGAFFHEPKYYIDETFIERESVTDEVNPDLPTLIDLGVPLTKMDTMVPQLIINHFCCNSGWQRVYDEYGAVDSLSPKALGSFLE